ncbi:MAG: repressor [Legionellales bacterium RIFCSPHIGHO2_12_FULL_42_9]|nr:MAG: repressor [Legionellales bacterium RIFCSPHIGHO2_12_FULL_42_9]
MNIRKEIGQRIHEARKAKSLTIKELGALTDNFKQTRVTNWEHGLRLPGPDEIKQLARALDVSAAYLMCLTDEKQPKKIPGLGLLAPLLTHEQACDPKSFIDGIKNKENTDEIIFIPLTADLSVQLNEHVFALKMLDDSMNPEMRINDIQIIDPSLSPEPGDYVAVKITGKAGVIICQYKKLSYTSPEFELLTLNDNWPNITVNEAGQAAIIGKVVQNIRGYL